MTLNRLPFDFENGLKVGGVDVTSLNQAFTPAGAGPVVWHRTAGGVESLSEFVMFGATPEGVIPENLDLLRDAPMGPSSRKRLETA